MTFSLDEATAMLAGTPTTLRSLSLAIPKSWLQANEGAQTFSPLDVLGHLIYGEKTDWIPRARKILESGESKPFEPFDRWGHREAIRGKTLEALLDEFARERAASLEALRGFALQPVDLSRRGTHPKFGSVTLEQLLATWVVHDLDHLAQIARVTGKQYRQAVGPWVEFLPMIAEEGRK